LTTTSKDQTASEDEGTGSSPDHYTPAEIEKKWQAKWEEDGIYKAADHVEGKENYFALTMFPYPSGDIHMGHWYAYAPADTYARFKRMQGYNVMHPQGFDSFGLPAENAAIERGADHGSGPTRTSKTPAASSARWARRTTGRASS
jgi:leucyl-tRNA synthetase